MKILDLVCLCVVVVSIILLLLLLILLIKSYGPKIWAKFSQSEAQQEPHAKNKEQYDPRKGDSKTFNTTPQNFSYQNSKTNDQQKLNQILNYTIDIRNEIKSVTQKNANELWYLKNENEKLSSSQKELEETKRRLTEEKEGLLRKLESLENEKQQLESELEKTWQNIRDFLPEVFKANSDLNQDVEKLCDQLDNPFAQRLLASISLLKHKTSMDSTEEIYYLIGVSLSSYLRECEKLKEEDICRKMRIFAAALSTDSVFIAVPNLGENYKVDQVRFINGGSKISKILSWCVSNNSGVFRCAEVE